LASWRGKPLVNGLRSGPRDQESAPLADSQGKITIGETIGPQYGVLTMSVAKDPLFKAEIAELKELFGDPVLSTEKHDRYDRILRELFGTLQPSDFMERRWVKQFADAAWDEVRHRRHITLFFTRKYQERQRFQAKRKLMLERQKKASDRESQAVNELDRLLELDEVASWGGYDDAGRLLARVPEESDHARALEAGFAYYEKLDLCIERALARQGDLTEEEDREALMLNPRWPAMKAALAA
jgi:hypothetical protein